MVNTKLVHGIKLTERECVGCTLRFFTSNDQKYCSFECMALNIGYHKARRATAKKRKKKEKYEEF